MGFLFAILGVVVGIAFGTVLLVATIGALGWNIAIAALVAALPPPVSALVGPIAGAMTTGSWLMLLVAVLIHLFLVFILYWLATLGTLAAIGGAPPPVPVVGSVTPVMPEPIGRGLMIGMNAGINYVFLFALLLPFFDGGSVAAVLALINLAASVPFISNSAIYQTVLGWTTLFLPMNLFWNAIGAIVLIINGIAAAFGVSLGLIPDWSRANLVMHGGVVHGCVQGSAFNMANFTSAQGTLSVTNPSILPASVWPFCAALGFAPTAPNRGTRVTVAGLAFHEGGHTLNAGAFGWLFHWIGFADQFLPMPWSPGGTPLVFDSYAEQAAESGLRGVGRNWITQWTPSSALTAPGNTPAVAAFTIADFSAGGPGVVHVVSPVVPGVFSPAAIAAERNRGIVINAGATADADGFPSIVGFLWIRFLAPAGSAAVIAGPNAPTLTFTPDAGGLYVIDLHVTDGFNGGPAAATDALVRFIVDVLAAGISGPGSVTAGNTIDLSANSSSLIPSASASNFGWSILNAPPGSGLTVGPIGAGSTISLTPAGTPPYTFEIELTVEETVQRFDGSTPVVLSDTARTTINVT